MSKTGFGCREKEIAEELGVPLDAVAEQRAKHLVRGQDYDRVGHFIAYAAAAKETILAVFRVPPEKAAVDQDKKKAAEVGTPTAEPANAEAGAGGEPTVQTEPEAVLAVVSALYRNTRLVGATIGINEIRVRVRNSRNFVRGMEIPVRHVRDDVYELARRAPRFRGKW